MKIKVIHEGGVIEIITLVPPVTAVLGNNLNHLTCGDGTDFFFTPEGFYDGWSRSHPGGVTNEESDRDMRRMEDGREIEESQ